MHEPRLPTEIWAMIVDDLPLPSKISCLSVSRLLHDIAIRPLFSLIRLCLRWNKERYAQDILDRIVSDSKFAQLVKRLVVIVDQLVPEKWELAKAIESMSYLVSFQWIGKAQHFSEGIAKAIASFCPRLRELALPVDGIVFHTPLLNLRSLRALQLSWARFPSSRPTSGVAFHDMFDYDHNKFDLDGQLRMIDANQNALRELHIISRFLDKVPMRILDFLTHLEIHIPHGYDIDDGLPFVFRHAVHLESLTIVGPGPIYFPLDTNTGTLPSLSSFHLSVPLLHWSQTWRSFCDFIRGRVSLQRICLRLRRYWSDLREILAIIKDLPDLRVLGLVLINRDIDWEFLALHLPATLESFQIILPGIRKDSFTPLCGALPNLTFLHIYDFCDVDYDLPVTAQELAHDMKHLRVVGLRWLLSDIVRVGNDEMLFPWNLEDKGRRVEEDEDIAWLLKYF